MLGSRKWWVAHKTRVVRLECRCFGYVPIIIVLAPLLQLFQMNVDLIASRTNASFESSAVIAMVFCHGR